MMSERQLREKIIDVKKELAILESVLNRPNDGMTGRPKGSIEHTNEQVEFLTQCNEANLTDKEIITAYNTKFNTNIPLTSRGLYNFMTRQGIKPQGTRDKPIRVSK